MTPALPSRPDDLADLIHRVSQDPEWRGRLDAATAELTSDDDNDLPSFEQIAALRNGAQG